MNLEREPFADTQPQSFAMEALVQRAQNGDSKAAGQLLEQFKPLRAAWVRRLAFRFPQESREELASEVNYAFLELLSAFEPGQERPFVAYMIPMLKFRMHNFVRNEYVRRTRTVMAEHMPVCDSGEEDSGNLRLASPNGRRECEEVLMSVWWEEQQQHLTRSQQRVMTLVLQGYSEREIACMLHVSPVAVHKSKRLAQKKLQQNWREG